jgi:peptidoglycan hydrolase CwlO-like protein
MADKILWVVAILMGTLALVAGCVNVNTPKGPYATINTGGPAVAPEDVNRVRTMDRQALEAEDLRLQAEVQKLRQTVDKLKNEVKNAERERDQYKDRVGRLEDQIGRLEDQIKDLRKR